MVTSSKKPRRNVKRSESSRLRAKLRSSPETVAPAASVINTESISHEADWANFLDDNSGSESSTERSTYFSRPGSTIRAGSAISIRAPSAQRCVDDQLRRRLRGKQATSQSGRPISTSRGRPVSRSSRPLSRSNRPVSRSRDVKLTRADIPRPTPPKPAEEVPVPVEEPVKAAEEPEPVVEKPQEEGLEVAERPPSPEEIVESIVAVGESGLAVRKRIAALILLIIIALIALSMKK